MKALLYFLVLCTFTFNSMAQVKTFETAPAYNDFIIGEQTKIGEAIKEFINTYGNSKDSIVIHDARKAIVAQADSSVSLIKKMVPFKDGAEMKKNAISLFSFYSSIAANEYKQLVEIAFNTRKSKEEMSKEMNEIIQDITRREKIVDTGFQGSQKAFAAKHNIELTENKFKIDE